MCEAAPTHPPTHPTPHLQLSKVPLVEAQHPRGLPVADAQKVHHLPHRRRQPLPQLGLVQHHKPLLQGGSGEREGSTYECKHTEMVRGGGVGRCSVVVGALSWEVRSKSESLDTPLPQSAAPSPPAGRAGRGPRA